MRDGVDDVGHFDLLVRLVVQVEDELGQAIEDSEIDGLRTLRELASVVRHHIADGADAEGRSLALVEDAARAVSGGKQVEGALDLPLLDAFSPRRWSR
jgi:hypothetical protein